MESGDSAEARASVVYVFNPFAEGYIAQGKGFTPVKHQALLASDLANLPQFLCKPHDLVLLAKRPAASFLKGLKQAGFPLPEFVELKEGRIDPASDLCQRKIDRLRPWAWGPDSIELLEPLFTRVSSGTARAGHYFNDDIARLYSKAWSAGFLRKALAHCHGWDAAPAEPSARTPLAASPPAQGRRGTPTGGWLCSEQEVGVAVATLDDALEAIAGIRGRGHQRVAVKAAHGLAGHNAIRLWEPELLPAQRQWLSHALRDGRQLVVEPWLERELDFSVQLEMGPRDLKLCGYTGLVNDRKGQFLANWVEADYARRLPAKVAALLSPAQDVAASLEHVYCEILTLLAAELQRVGFVGPVNIDAFVYRAPQGDCRLKPVVEINPRCTMGRVALELMKHVCPGSCGWFRLVTRTQARGEGFGDLVSYARSLAERLPLQLEDDPAKIRQGALCLNDAEQAQVCLATFEVRPETHG